MKFYIPSLLLLMPLLFACGKDAYLISTFKDSVKTDKSTKGVNANAKKASVGLNADAFKHECANMKGYGALPTDTKQGLLVGETCVVMSSQKLYNTAALNADPQEISAGLAPGSLIISNGAMSGSPILITLDSSKFMELGERKIAPDTGGKLSFFTVGRPGDVTLASVTIWDCYNNKLEKVICAKNIIP